MFPFFGVCWCEVICCLCFYGPQTSAQTLTVGRPQIQTWSQGEVWAWIYHGPRWQHRPPALAQSSTVSGTTDINIDAGFSRATDPGMALYHNLGLDDTMTPGGSTGHPNQPGPGYGTALGHNQGHRLWPRPRGFGVAPSSNMDHGHQPRTWSWQEHGPRHGPQQQTGSSCHHGPT